MFKQALKHVVVSLTVVTIASTTLTGCGTLGMDGSPLPVGLGAPIPDVPMPLGTVDATGGVTGERAQVAVALAGGPILQGLGWAAGILGVAVLGGGAYLAYSENQRYAGNPNSSSNTNANIGGSNQGGPKPPPDTLLAFPDAKRVTPKSFRKRWKDSDSNIYEWDYQHGRVEKYNRRGQHLGEFDDVTGHQYGGPVPGRSVEP